MPTRITRYVTFELLRSFAIALTAMTCLMVLVFLIQEGLKENLTLSAVLRLIPYTLPMALCFAIPGTILFAACVCYGRMTSQNEILAVEAAGISPIRLIVPALVISFVLSAATVWLNDVAASWGRRGIYQVVLQTSAQTIYSMLGTQGTLSKGKIHIWVDGVEGENLVRPFIICSDDSPDNGTEIRAQLARILADAENERLVIRLKDAEIRAGNKASIWVDQHDLFVPLGDVTRNNNDKKNPSVFALNQIPGEIRLQQARTRGTKARLGAWIATDMLAGNMVSVTHPEWGTRFHELHEQHVREYKLKSEPWRRWANGFSCLAFVIVGAPLSILLQRFDFWTNFALCFFPILLVYYPLLMFGVGEAKSGNLPGVVVWLGNVVMMAIGVAMVRKVRSR